MLSTSKEWLYHWKKRKNNLEQLDNHRVLPHQKKKSRSKKHFADIMESYAGRHTRDLMIINPAHGAKQHRYYIEKERLDCTKGPRPKAGKANSAAAGDSQTAQNKPIRHYCNP